jgi:nucleotide-binding universal stress UspA family protein
MRVLIATDGSDTSAEAVRVAGGLLQPDFEAVLVTVVEDLPFAGDDAGGLEGPTLDPSTAAEMRAEAFAEREAMVEEAAHLLLRTRGAESIETRIEAGDAGRAICQVADEEAVDLIVVGTHDRSLFSRIVNGSVSRWVAEHADRPVLIARGGGARAA